MAIIEQALYCFGKEKIANLNLLLCAGTLDDNEAETMLRAISSNRQNKKIDINLEL